MNLPVRWAVLGASTIAREKMIPAIRAAGGLVVAVQSGNLERARDFARELSIEHAVDRASDAVAFADAVYVGSANEAHFQQGLDAIAAGRHVLCEKPIALTLEQADAMVSAAKARKVLLAVNHHLRSTALHRTLRYHIVEGSIGEVRSVTILNAGLLPEALRTWRLMGPGAGICLDKTVHDADLLRFLLDDEPSRLIAMAGSPAGEAAERSVMGSLQFRSGIIAQFYEDFDTPFTRTRLEIFGSKGRLIATDCLSGRPTGALTLVTAAGSENVEIKHVEPYEAVIDNFQQAMRGNATLAVAGADGRAALAVALAAQTSLRTGRSVNIDYTPTPSTLRI